MAPNAWDELAAVYEQARSRLDSFDRILEWPAQQALPGDVAGLRILDVGCGSGAKAVALAESGAAEVVGIDSAEAFVAHDHLQHHPRPGRPVGEIGWVLVSSALLVAVFGPITMVLYRNKN